MIKSRKSRLAAILSVCAVSMAFAAPAEAQNRAGDSLINVQLSNVDVLVPVSVAANLCDINVNILAQQQRDGGAECTATAESVATPGDGDGGGGNRAGNSLVNVQLDDFTVAVPIAVAANVCDVNANVLAIQLRNGGAQCDARSESQAG